MNNFGDPSSDCGSKTGSARLQQNCSVLKIDWREESHTRRNSSKPPLAFDERKTSVLRRRTEYFTGAICEAFRRKAYTTNCLPPKRNQTCRDWIRKAEEGRCPGMIL